MHSTFLSRVGATVGLALALISGGCQKAAVEPDMTCGFGTTDAPAQLCNSQWKLRGLNGNSLGAESAGSTGIVLTLNCAQATFSGTAVCNRYSGTIAQNSPQQLRLNLLNTTEAHCGLAGTEQEQQYFEALRQVFRYELQGTTLRLFDATNSATPRLVFEAR